jgi:hypothetical protein
MPRIYTSANDPLDFCADCFPDCAEAEEDYGDIGTAPEGNCFEHNAEHPLYEGWGYTCERCKKKLTKEDD